MDPARTPGLRVHHLLAGSHANGPGERAVVWVQGCTRGCSGCFNPETHDPGAGTFVPLPGLVEWYKAAAPGSAGLTVSGGEPLEQAASLRLLLEAARAAADLPILLFTGWTWAEVQASSVAVACVHLADAAVLGPFVRELAPCASPWGSSNQELRLLTDRFTAADFAAFPAAEVWVDGDGDLVVTGTDPPPAP